MKQLISLILIIITTVGYAQKYSSESEFTAVDENVRFGNMSHLFMKKVEFHKKEAKGLDENGVVARYKKYAVGLCDLRKGTLRGDTYSTMKLNLKGEMNFEDSKDVVVFNRKCRQKQVFVNGKMRCFATATSSTVKGNIRALAVTPIYQAPLQVDGVDVLVIASSVDDDVEYNPQADELLIYESYNRDYTYRQMRAIHVKLDVPFTYHTEDKWWVMRWNDKKKTIRVEEAKFTPGYITSPVDWKVSLGPGNMCLHGKANEKVILPPVKCSGKVLTFTYGDVKIVEFGFDMNSRGKVAVVPEYDVKEHETLVLEPCPEVDLWCDYGWYKNQLTLVAGFENDRGAKLMQLVYKNKNFVWNCEVYDAKSGKLIHSHKMHRG